MVEPLYEPSQNYKFGRSTWSWIVWQDQSMNYEDQMKFIDLASSLRFEFILIALFIHERSILIHCLFGYSDLRCKYFV